MSIEEAGLHEMEMMQKMAGEKFQVHGGSKLFWHNEGTRPMAEDEVAEVEKARAWDDWKDDYRRGAGNKKLTPCG